jgi:hypothetical protein
MIISKELHEKLLKVKRAKKGIVAWMLQNKYSKKYAEQVSANWKDLEVKGITTSTTKTTKAPASKSKKTVSKSKKSTGAKVAVDAGQITNILNQDNEQTEVIKEQELILNISEGSDVLAELQVKKSSHPKFVLGTLVNILKKNGAKVQSTSNIPYSSEESFQGMSLAINQVE